MTPEEINKIPFKWQSHLNMEGCHSTTYKAQGVPFTLLMCDRVKMDINGRPKGKTTRHFMLNGKVYKTAQALYKAMEEL